MDSNSAHIDDVLDRIKLARQNHDNDDNDVEEEEEANQYDNKNDDDDEEGAEPVDDEALAGNEKIF